MPGAKKMNKAQKQARINQMCKSSKEVEEDISVVSGTTGKLLSDRRKLSEREINRLTKKLKNFINGYQSCDGTNGHGTRAVNPNVARHFTKDCQLQSFGVEVENPQKMFSSWAKSFLSGEFKKINGKLNEWSVGGLGSTWHAWEYMGQNIRVGLGKGTDGFKWNLSFRLPENASSLDAAWELAKNDGQNSIHIHTSHDGETKTFTMCWPNVLEKIMPWEAWKTIMDKCNEILNEMDDEEMKVILENPKDFIGEFIKRKVVFKNQEDVSQEEWADQSLTKIGV